MRSGPLFFCLIFFIPYHHLLHHHHQEIFRAAQPGVQQGAAGVSWSHAPSRWGTAPRTCFPHPAPPSAASPDIRPSSRWPRASRTTGARSARPPAAQPRGPWVSEQHWGPTGVMENLERPQNDVSTTSLVATLCVCIHTCMIEQLWLCPLQVEEVCVCY